MPRFRIQTNQGVFEIEANRAPTEDEVQELITSGQLTPSGGAEISAQPQGATATDIATQQTAERPTAPSMASQPPSLREMISGQAFGRGAAFGEGLSNEATIDTESLREELNKPIPQMAIGLPIDIGAEMGGQQLGAIAGGALGSRLGPVGRKIGAGAGRALGGGIASAASALGQQRARGDAPTANDVGNELLLSFLPEALESGVRATGRRALRASHGGQEIRMDEVAKRTLRKAPRVFDSPARKAVSQQFQAVEQTGLRFDLGGLRREFADMPKQLEDIIKFDVRAIDRAGRTGKRFEGMIDAIQAGDNVPIGDLQDLRSVLLKREGRASQEAQRVIERVRLAVDEAVDNAPAVPGAQLAGQNVDEIRTMLQTARQEWKRVRSAEDLAVLVGSRPVSSLARNGRMIRFNMNALLNTLRDNKTALARQVNQSLDALPGPRVVVEGLGKRPQKFAEYLEEMKAILPQEIRLSHTQGLVRAVPGIAAASNVMADMMVSPLGQRVFRKALIKGRGTLSLNRLAIAATTLRRHAATLEETGGQTIAELDAIANDIVQSIFRPEFPETAGQPIGR